MARREWSDFFLEQFNARISALEMKSKDAKADQDAREGTKSEKADGAEEAKHEPDLKEEEQTEKPTSRARVVTRKLDPFTGRVTDTESGDAAKSKPDKVEGRYAFQLKKFLENSRRSAYGELEIYGKELQTLLNALLRHGRCHLFLGDKIILASPYEPLIHNWDLLSRQAEQRGSDDRGSDDRGSDDSASGDRGSDDKGSEYSDKRARSDLRLLLETLQDGSGDPALDGFFDVREALKASHTITFETLWTIFPPGTLVYSRPFLMKSQIFVVKEASPAQSHSGSRFQSMPPWTLDCWTYDWDGVSFRRRTIQLEVEAFEGSKPISALLVHPLEYAENPEAISKELLSRGRLFREYCASSNNQRMFTYSGGAIFAKKGFRGIKRDADDDSDNVYHRYGLHSSAATTTSSGSPQSPGRAMVNGEVMVDFASYYKYGVSTAQIADLEVTDEYDECDCNECMKDDELMAQSRTRYDGKKGQEDEEWEEDQLMLCPPRVLGYVLREKQWAQLDVEKIKQTSEKGRKDAFENRLKLHGEEDGKTTKQTLMGLIENHGIGEASRGNAGYQLNDLVAEKGKGLVILLYGPPGVGKTSTAQTIATAAGKPLISIGVADVGTSANLVESNLEKIFDLATTWSAILLIDEADVFLQSRAKGEGAATERNALVSVFLRVLEYYQGILILTTNQIAQFDVAVQSRVHIAIKYEALDKQQTIEIFMGFLNQYHKRNLVQGYDDITNYVKNTLPRKGFDGRQLRNIITSAMGIAIARKETPRMTRNDLEEVVGLTESFKMDLEYQMRRYQDAQRGANFG